MRSAILHCSTGSIVLSACIQPVSQPSDQPTASSKRQHRQRGGGSMFLLLAAPESLSDPPPSRDTRRTRLSWRLALGISAPDRWAFGLLAAVQPDDSPSPGDRCAYKHRPHTRLSAVHDPHAPSDSGDYDLRRTRSTSEPPFSSSTGEVLFLRGDGRPIPSPRRWVAGKMRAYFGSLSEKDGGWTSSAPGTPSACGKEWGVLREETRAPHNDSPPTQPDRRPG